MKVTKTNFPGLLIIEPEVYNDIRGYFFESYNNMGFLDNGIDFYPLQDNESKSAQNVIRGLHYQLNPKAQAKLIRVIKGKIFDVAVDLRSNSPTYKKWFGLFLDSDEKKQLFIPRGFAHGFSVISDEAVILYKCDNLYSKDHERGILFNDKTVGIDWQIDLIKAIVSDKDLNNPDINAAEMNF
ncbi:MAG: dTDP-4-dehydrorhamnose 3,5-epimerase [Bacteroidales bacterium]|nr:dTDP-4-dehydrorhamnose 3,5-epimerase [Bacteroidales bacterium]